ncbi:cation:proton antiporter regulatory subunit [Haloferax volcanii]|uniref:TrkA-C domain-containing protein n=3 Tax=Haloferax volcanii TaxID=2246 RepID=A0A384KGU0_HALVD|nr:TrkA C-terminal domain-containing protein [Haloferax volcanii]ADE03458.1 TrkA-C domain protein [Haloferax volcanii DS2]ELY32525.1 TrkA-C domain-containing protein [Haloferax volcanii DS2]MBS8118377.1 TrkA C-terminal domain-containing protein [Haloferax volcanii]MBS8123390.1 TrkA C-terminal domain-containing protein [Haloferax volcanii]MBS8127258.1 TrkA C-terminal domain-containing protein [Haloferax volcanii]
MSALLSAFASAAGAGTAVSVAPAADLFAAVGGSPAAAGQVSIPPADDSLVLQALRLVGLVVGAFVVSAVASLLYRWYTREIIPRALAVLFGGAVVALYLNTIGLFGAFTTGTETEVFQLDTVVFNVASLAGGALIAPVGRVAGDRLATDVFAVAGAKELDADVSRLVRTVGRVTSVTLPEDIADIEGYDPVGETVKTQLSGKTLLFPRRLGEAELRDRLATRIKDDHGVGHVDVEFEAGGSEVSYLALGSRAAGLGPTLAPGTVAVAIRGDPGSGAAAGDPVQVWSVPKPDAADDDPAADAIASAADATESPDAADVTETAGGGPDPGSLSDGGTDTDAPAEPTRVAFGELRGVADDVATVALDAEDADRLASGETYRLVTLPADPHVDREFASLLRNADETMAVTTVAPDADLDGLTVSDVDTTVVAIRSSNRPVDAIPGRGRELAAGDTLYVVGRPEVLRKVERRATTDTGRTDGGDDDGADTGGSDGEASRSSGAQSS